MVWLILDISDLNCETFSSISPRWVSTSFILSVYAMVLSLSCCTASRFLIRWLYWLRIACISFTFWPFSKIFRSFSAMSEVSSLLMSEFFSVIRLTSSIENYSCCISIWIFISLASLFSVYLLVLATDLSMMLLTWTPISFGLWTGSVSDGVGFFLIR